MKNNQNKIALIMVCLLVVSIIALFVFKSNNDNDDDMKDVYYTVSFNSNGADNVGIQTIFQGGMVVEPKDPVKEGYIFLGWYVGEELFDFNKKIDDNLVLEARWEKIGGEDVDLDDMENNDDSSLDNDSSENNNSSTNDGDDNKKPTTTDKINVTGITLNKNSLTLDVGGSYKLVATIKPNNATDKKVTWTSSNSKVVTIKNGEVKAVGAGSAVITASAGGKSVKCNVTVNKVKDDTVAVTSIMLNKSSLTLDVGGTATLVATVNPDNATDKKVTWTSSDSRVVTVNNGEIKAVGTGSAVITASVGGKSVKCNVTVNKKITYSYEWVKIESSSVGQYYLYIVSSEGKKVEGLVKVNYTNGKSNEQDVPVGGLTLVKDVVASVEIISVK